MRAPIFCTALLLAGCAAVGPRLPTPGQGEAEVLAAMGPPTGRYAMPEGETRLEYATGPYGRHTWMIDLDPAGRVREVDQVLREGHFEVFMQRAPGMTVPNLLRTLGRPGETRQVGRFGDVLWSYRYPTNDCLWFQVQIGADNLVKSAGYGIDPRCDPPSDRH